ncbi:GNAT family N-acetyltransferase [Salinarimonas sp.]|uniref:GNAT family N-acetyltransferase n=1 Tax=Salinarimonas sp. TaxID=2766526 RepID=UPI0032D906AF
MPDAVVRRLDATEAAARCGELAEILLDCVAGGASVSFMADTTPEDARAFWAGVAESVAAGRTILVIAESAEGRLLGTAQVSAAGKPNQPHRGDLAKMLVHRAARGRGLGAALLAAAEREALAAGLWLLVLDTTPGTPADRLYTRGGWVPVGVIPDFALWPQGGLGATKVFYKDLRAG